MRGSTRSQLQDPWASLEEVQSLAKPSKLAAHEMTAQRFADRHGITASRADRMLKRLVEQGKAEVEKRMIWVHGIGRMANVFTLRGVKDATPKTVDRPAGRNSRR